MGAKTTGLRVLRWLAVVPISLLAALSAQVILAGTTGRLLLAVFGKDLFSIIWAAKSVSSFFMGATFLLVARWTAPTRKHLVSHGALGVVLAWSGFLMSGAFEGSRFVGWLFFMGVSGAMGGVAAYLVSRRRDRPNGRVATHAVTPRIVRSSGDDHSNVPALAVPPFSMSANSE